MPVRGNGGAFIERNLHLEAAQALGIGNALDTREMEDGLPEMHATRSNRDWTRRAAAVAKPHLRQSRQSLRKVGQDFGGYLATPAPGPQDASHGQSREEFRSHYSRISSVKRFLSFIPAAPRMVRIDFAVRP